MDWTTMKKVYLAISEMECLYSPTDVRQNVLIGLREKLERLEIEAYEEEQRYHRQNSLK